MSDTPSIYADKAGFHDSGQDVHEKINNGARIHSEFRQRIQSRFSSTTGCAFCLQSPSGKFYQQLSADFFAIISFDFPATLRAVNFVTRKMFRSGSLETEPKFHHLFHCDTYFGSFFFLAQFAGGLDSETLCAIEEIRQRVPRHMAGSRELLAGIPSS